MFLKIRSSGGSVTTPIPFPELLRHHRVRAGLTQRALADLSTVSPRAIRDLEAGRANARTQTIHLLADGLHLQGAMRELFVTASLTRRPTGPFDNGCCTAAPTAPDALIGRETEVLGLLEVLESGRRMIALSGLPGVGKTRLAAEVATRAGARHDWPVLWIGTDMGTLHRHGTAYGPLLRSLKSLADADSAEEDPVGQVRQLIGRHEALLVLDGLAEATMPLLVRELLAQCPGLRVITTSRRPWHVAGAHPAVVAPLPTPPIKAETPAELAGVPSVRLFVERLAQARPGFALSTANALAAAEICRRLDGLPLALEVVAERGRVLSPQQLAEVTPADLLDLAVPARPDRQALTIGALVGASLARLGKWHHTILCELAGTARPGTVTDVVRALGHGLDEVAAGLDVLIGCGLVRASHSEVSTELRVPNLVRTLVLR
ncbi:XRE family transcriptional regulator [Winogradskya humida]|uniref:XRE family transcriptional regulator n=1 Tax=Winogradskya humida TaxID=113566 RepID=A0ABQ3ZJE3_9ACTN|nr:XRE family transcriptional regulator [Actinoplanes humidus]